MRSPSASCVATAGWLCLALLGCSSPPARGGNGSVATLSDGGASRVDGSPSAGGGGAHDGGAPDGAHVDAASDAASPPGGCLPVGAKTTTEKADACCSQSITSNGCNGTGCAATCTCTAYGACHTNADCCYGTCSGGSCAPPGTDLGGPDAGTFTDDAGYSISVADIAGICQPCGVDTDCKRASISDPGACVIAAYGSSDTPYCAPGCDPSDPGPIACPTGTACVLADEATSQDPVYVCWPINADCAVPPSGDVCVHCPDGTGCTGQSDQCVDDILFPSDVQNPNNYYCAPACSGGCPPGTTCQSTTNYAGSQVSVCYPIEGACFSGFSRP